MRRHILAALIAAVLAQAASAAWLSDWLYRSEVVIDSTKIIGPAKTNFPLLITLTAADSTIFNNAHFYGNDLRFTKAGGDTLLSYELVRYDLENLHAEIWVKIPALGDLRNTIWIYYGKPDAESASNPADVWADYAVVLHYDNHPAYGRLLDSSPNDLQVDLLTSSGSTWNATSPSGPHVSPATGYAYLYDVSETAQTTELNVWQKQWTLQAWVFQYEDGTNFLAQGGPGWFQLAASDDHDNDMQYASSTVDLRFHNGLATPNAWHFMAFQSVASGDSMRAFLDGTMDASATVVAGTLTRHGIGGGAEFGLGSTQYLQSACQDCMQGLVDELRVRAGTPLTNGWLRTEYNNQLSPSTFYAIGALEANACE